MIIFMINYLIKIIPKKRGPILSSLNINRYMNGKEEMNKKRRNSKNQ